MKGPRWKLTLYKQEGDEGDVSKMKLEEQAQRSNSHPEGRVGKKVR